MGTLSNDAKNALETCLKEQAEWVQQRVLHYSAQRGVEVEVDSLRQTILELADGCHQAIIAALQRNSSTRQPAAACSEIQSGEIIVGDPLSAFGVSLAKRQNGIGANRGFPRALLEDCRRTYQDLAERAGWPLEIEHEAQDFLDRSLERLEVAFTTEWGLLPGEQLRGALEQYNRMLARERNRYLAIFEVLPDPVYLLTKEGRIADLNHAGAAFLTKFATEATPSSIPWLETELPAFRASGELARDFERELSTAQGQRFCLVQLRRMLDEEEHEAGTIVILHDLTARKRAEDDLRFLSFHDSLTHLFNRAYFQEELVRLNTWRQLPLSLVMGDVNALKLANDAFGHAMGDRLLVRMAQILRHAFRQEDIIARWGGDEFVVILPKTPHEVALRICDRIRESCLASPADPVRPSIALGIATKIEPSQDLDQLLQEAEVSMYAQKLKETKAARSGLIELMKETLSLSGLETEEHIQTLRRLSMAMGCRLGFSERQLEELSLLAAFHDIGEIAIPAEILRKVGRLSDDDWEIIRQHPEIGYRIAGTSPEIAAICDLILAHQERWDGSGYPKELRGETIPLPSRILAIVDAYDAMIRGRPFREAISPDAARRELQRSAGTQFDPSLVQLFLEVEQGNLAD
ncbi:MAG: diguanylate cyclase [Coprothermobacterota bacterium]|nr:diguanylate cyclase [Coprothermobacterota bacterium]